MKTFLTHRDQDFDLQRKPPWNGEALIEDLELNTLFKAMALNDPFLFEVAKSAVLCGLTNDPDTILYRQDVLKDCLDNPEVIRDIYDTAAEAMEAEKKHYFGFFASRYPSSILGRSVDVLQIFMGLLKKLRNIVDEGADRFRSEGFLRFFSMLKAELDDEYFNAVQNHLKELKFREGVMISAELGEGNKGANYVLRKTPDRQGSWKERFLRKKPVTYTFRIDDRDHNGFSALSELKDRGINLAADALARSTDHILAFFTMLRTELAFYVGCMNLHGQLMKIGMTVSLPLSHGAGTRNHSFKGLYDPCLALTMEQKVVGNDMNGDNRNPVIITGANQGGKSTFLRSIGLSQLMMQCGMFVPAERLSATVCDGLFTHYRREEDTTMKSGKLDEELGRMSDIVDHMTANPMVLFNESFAATNEREGSEIARQIVSALLEKGIRVFFVTHFFQFAYGFVEREVEGTLFLRSERQAEGGRTFKLIEGEPAETSYGEDLYDKIFKGRTTPPEGQAGTTHEH